MQRLSAAQFGTTRSGENVRVHTLENVNGMRVSVCEWGAIITELTGPDRAGDYQNVVLAYDSLEAYEGNEAFVGCVVGRYANRIAHGRFSVGEVGYQLDTNDNGVHHIHGGRPGFGRVLWTRANAEPANDSELSLSYRSSEGEAGYPGNVEAIVTFRLDDSDELHVTYAATSDKTTPLNLTHHSYYNLDPVRSSTIVDHWLKLRAERFTPSDGDLIPTGELVPVENTSLDFRQLRRIGDRIAAGCAHIGRVGGYDHNYALDQAGGDGNAPDALLVEPVSGRKLEIRTTKPGIQLYTSNTLHTAAPPGGRRFAKWGAVCLETQHFPDSPNKPHFPSSLLAPGEAYRFTTSFKVGAITAAEQDVIAASTRATG